MTFRKRSIKIVLISLALVVAVLVALLIMKGVQNNKQQNEHIPVYDIVFEGEYIEKDSLNIFKGSSSVITPILFIDGEKHEDINFEVLARDLKGVEVTSKVDTVNGIRNTSISVNCIEDLEESETIKVTATKYNYTEYLTVNYIKKLEEIYSITCNDSDLIIGDTTTINFDIRPADVNLDDYVTYKLKYVQGNETIDIPMDIYDYLVDVNYSSRSVYVKMLGIGELVLELAVRTETSINPKYYSFNIKSSFKDQEITNSILSNFNVSAVSNKELNQIEHLVVTNDTEADFTGLEILTNIQTIVFASSKKVDVIGDLLKCDYRVKINSLKDDQLLLSYLNDEKYSELTENIIPYMNNYDEKFIVYHHYIDDVETLKFVPNIDVYGTSIYAQLVEDNCNLINENSDYLVNGYDFYKWTKLNSSEKVNISDINSEKNGFHIYANWNPMVVNLLLNDYDGTVNTYSVTFDEAYGEIPVASKNGFVFDGWFYNEDYNEDDRVLSTEISQLIEDTAIYAKFTTTLTVDYYGLSETEVFENIVYGKDLSSVLKEPTNQYWNFEGWYSTKYGSGLSTKLIEPTDLYYGEGTIDGTGIKIYSKWNKDINLEFYSSYNVGLTWNNKVNVIFGVPLNSSEDKLPEKFNIGEDEELPNWNFEGWYDNVNRTGNIYTNDSIFNNLEQFDTLYAKFTSIIRYQEYPNSIDYINQENDVISEPVKIVFGTEVDIKNHNRIVGYDFIRWYADSYKFEDKLMINDFNFGNVILKPEFKELNYKIIYYYNDEGKINPLEIEVEYSIYHVTFDYVTSDTSLINLLNQSIAEKIDSGLKVKNWNYYVDESMTKLRTDEISFENFTTIYAVPTYVGKDYEIRYFNYSHDTSDWYDLAYLTRARYNEEVELIDFEPNLDGWDFNGWYYLDNSGNKQILKSGDTYNLSKDINLYADYSAKITLNSVVNQNSNLEPLVLTQTVSLKDDINAVLNNFINNIKASCSNNIHNWQLVGYSDNVTTCVSDNEINYLTDEDKATYTIGTNSYYIVWGKEYTLNSYNDSFEYVNETESIYLYYSLLKGFIDDTFDIYDNYVELLLNNIILDGESTWVINSWWIENENKDIRLKENQSYLLYSDIDVINITISKKISIKFDSGVALSYKEQLNGKNNTILGIPENKQDYAIQNDVFNELYFDIYFNKKFTAISCNGKALIEYLNEIKNDVEHFTLVGLLDEYSGKYYSIDQVFYNEYIIANASIEQFKLVYQANDYSVTYYKEDYSEHVVLKYSILDKFEEPTVPNKFENGSAVNSDYYTSKWRYEVIPSNEIYESLDTVLNSFESFKVYPEYTPVTFKVYIKDEKKVNISSILGLDEFMVYKYGDVNSSLNPFSEIEKLYPEIFESSKEEFYQHIHKTGYTYVWKCYEFGTDKELTENQFKSYKGDVEFRPSYIPIEYNLRFEQSVTPYKQGFNIIATSNYKVTGSYYNLFDVLNSVELITIPQPAYFVGFTSKWMLYISNENGEQYLELDNNYKIPEEYIEEYITKDSTIIIRSVYENINYSITFEQSPTIYKTEFEKAYNATYNVIYNQNSIYFGIKDIDGNSYDTVCNVQKFTGYVGRWVIYISDDLYLELDEGLSISTEILNQYFTINHEITLRSVYDIIEYEVRFEQKASPKTLDKDLEDYETVFTSYYDVTGEYFNIIDTNNNKLSEVLSVTNFNGYSGKWYLYISDKEDNKYIELDENNVLPIDAVKEYISDDEVIILRSCYELIDYTISYVDEFGNEVETITYDTENIDYSYAPLIPHKMLNDGVTLDDGTWFDSRWAYYQNEIEYNFENITYGDIIVRPVYTEDTYTVSYYIDNRPLTYALLGEKPYTYSTSKEEFINDLNINEAATNQLTPIGYRFIGWKDFEITAFGFNIFVDWQYIEYTVTYLYDQDKTPVQQLNKETGLMENVTSTHTISDCVDDIYKPSIINHEGYQLSWRYVDALGTVLTNKLTPYDLIVYVNYTEKPYKLNFYVDDELYYTSIYYINNTTRINPINEPTKEGYTFDGWYIDNNEYNLKWDEYVLTYGDVNIIAKFNPIYYSISYTFDDLSVEEVSYYIDGLYESYIPEVPNINGKVGKWVYYDEENQVVNEIKAGNLTAKLEYEYVSYSITYKVNGEEIDKSLYNVDTEIAEFDIPTLEDDATWIYYDEKGLVIELQKGITGNLIARPDFEELVYSVYYIDENGNYIGRVEYTESNPILENEPTLSLYGYDFENWVYYSADTLEEVTEIISGHLIAKPIITEHIYNITFVDATGKIIMNEEEEVKSSYSITNHNFDIPEYLDKSLNGLQYKFIYYNNLNNVISFNDLTIGDLQIMVYYEEIIYSIDVLDSEESFVYYTVSNNNPIMPNPIEKVGYRFDHWEYRLASDDSIVVDNITIGDLIAIPIYVAIDYTVTFEDSEGNVVAKEIYNIENMTIEEPEVPEKIGYLGVWRAYLDGMNEYKNIIVKPIYTEQIYKAYYYENQIDNIESYVYGQKDYSINDLVALETVTLYGSTVEWVFHIYKDNEFIKITNVVDSIEQGYKEVYAWPKEAEITITYYNVNKSESVAVRLVDANTLLAEVHEPNAPIIKGNTFVKWSYYTIDNLLVDSNDYIITSDIYALPKYEYTVYPVVYYNLNNEIISQYDVSFTIVSNSFENVPEVPSPMDGYQNGVWNYYLQATDQAVSLEQIISGLVFDRVYAKPHYDYITYNICFFDENGSCVATESFNIDTKIEDINIPIMPEKAGYRYEFNIEELPTHDINVGVEYKPLDYTISFYDENEIYLSSISYSVDNKNPKLASVPYKEYYEGSWKFYLADSISDVTESNEVLSIQNGNLIAIPTYKPINYTLTFVDEFGAKLYEIIYNILDEEVIYPSTSIIDKVGYICNWNIENLLYEDMIVSPIYTPIAYEVKFIRNSETINTFTYTIESIEFDIPELQSKDGYTYTWTLNGSPFDLSSLVIGNQEVIELCEIITYTIKFVDENNDLIDIRYFTEVDKTFSIPDGIPHVDYRVGYWELNGEKFNEDSKLSLLDKCYEDLVVYAKYDIEMYKLTFQNELNEDITDEYGNVIYFEYYVDDNGKIQRVNFDGSKFPKIPEKLGYNGQWAFNLIAGVDTKAYINYTLVDYYVKFYKSYNDIIDGKNPVDTKKINIEDKSFELTTVIPNVSWKYYDKNGTEVNINEFIDNDLAIFDLYACPIDNEIENFFTIKYYNLDNVVINYQTVTVGTALSDVSLYAIPNATGMENGRWIFRYKGDLQEIPYDTIINEEVELEATLQYDYKEYKIFFNDAESSVSTYTMINKEVTNIPEIPNIIGYDAYWKYILNNKEVLLDSNNYLNTNELGDVYAEIIYTPIKYKVTFKQDNLEDVIRYYTITDKTFSVPSIVNIDGYSSEWIYYSASDETIIVEEFTYGDLIAKPKYSLITYEVLFVDDFNNKLGIAEYTVEDYSFMDSVARLEKEGYSFEWAYYLASDDTLVDQVSFGNLIARPNYIPTVYLALFMCNRRVIACIEFDINSLDFEEPECPTKEGYISKWADYNRGLNSITVTAEFTPIEYTISYNGELSEIVTYNIEDKSNVIEPQLKTKDGVEGIWEYYNEFGNKVTLNKDTYGNLTAYPNYDYDVENNYIVKFALTDGTIVKTTLFNVEANIRDLEIPYLKVHPAYSITKWDIPESITSDITIYPSYKYPLEFNVHMKNAYNEIIEDISYNINNIDLVSADIRYYQVEKLGYKLIGWNYYTNDTLNNSIELSEIGTTYFGDVWAEPIFDPITYVIHFDPVLGEGEIDDINCTYGNGIKLPKYNFTRTGYTQNGWLINGVYHQEDDIVSNLTTIDQDTFIIEPSWSINTYLVSYFNGEYKFDNNYKDTTYTVDFNIDSLDLVRPLYNTYTEYNNFVGWYYDEACTVAYSKEDVISNPRDLVLYPKWDNVRVIKGIGNTGNITVIPDGKFVDGTRVLVDWRGSSDTDVLNYTRGVKAGNIDILDVKEIIFIGDKGVEYQNLTLTICSYTNKDLLLKFVDFSFTESVRSDVMSGAITLWNDSGVNLTVDLNGECNITAKSPTNGVFGSSDNKFKNLNIISSSTTNSKFQGCDANSSSKNGGSVIYAGNLNIQISGILTMIAGYGYSGSTPSGSGSKGTDGGAGGTTIIASNVQLLGGTIIIEAGNGAIGGNGSTGKQGTGDFWSAGDGGTGGTGGTGGAGGNGITCDSINISNTVLTVQSGAGGQGGTGGRGGNGYQGTSLDSSNGGKGGTAGIGGANGYVIYTTYMNINNSTVNIRSNYTGKQGGVGSGGSGCGLGGGSKGNGSTSSDGSNRGYFKYAISNKNYIFTNSDISYIDLPRP